MASRLVTPEDVLESLMNDGIIDGIRMKIIAQLKANEDMKKNTMMMVEQSKVLNTPGAEKKTKRELFDSLRRELETPVLEKASKAVWELMLDNNGLGKEITETVERVYCRLTGLDLPPPPPPPPPPSSEGQQQEEKENRDKEEDEKAKEMDVSVSLSRKRSFGDMSMQGVDAAANGSSKHFPVVSDDGGQKSSKPKT